MKQLPSNETNSSNGSLFDIQRLMKIASMTVDYHYEEESKNQENNYE
jgi:hypothetical protein